MIGEPCSLHLYNYLKSKISDISPLMNRGDIYMEKSTDIIDLSYNIEECLAANDYFTD